MMTLLKVNYTCCTIVKINKLRPARRRGEAFCDTDHPTNVKNGRTVHLPVAGD